MSEISGADGEFGLTSEDRRALEKAVRQLECVGLAMKLANFLGKRIQTAMEVLPQELQDLILKATKAAIEGCAGLAMKTIDPSATHEPFNVTHKAICAAFGAISGFFGTAALVAELPFTTAIMVRSFLEIARYEGEDLSQPEAKLTSIEVFGLGDNTGLADTNGQPYYYTERDSMTSLKAAAARIGAQQASREFALYLDMIVSRYVARVTEKVVAQSQPVVGAIGGGAINLIFTSHYQEIAGGHFTIRRLERRYHPEYVRREYENVFRTLTCE